MIILGSTSPRRREILGYFSLPFQAVAPPFDEEAIPFQGNPEAFVCTLSQGKAKSLLPSYPGSIILTADTVVYANGKIYGKPKTPEEACRSLSELTHKWHTVYTGVTVIKEGKIFNQAEATQVLFNDLTTPQIEHYIAHTHWADKAGGYAIQLAGGLIVRKIDGCYYNVMGLPINTVAALLKKAGIELWNFL
jgi:septum formation protein